MYKHFVHYTYTKIQSSTVELYKKRYFGKIFTKFCVNFFFQLPGRIGRIGRYFYKLYFIDTLYLIK